MSRSATVVRTTKETQVEATLELDGEGRYDVETENRFLTHMVETWTRYAGFDLRLRATGDLDHHLVEDVAITLGQAFRQAFAQAPCTRIAYDFVPMDDALVLAAVDLVDRPFYAGELAVPLHEHWFRSFAMEARINLHLEVLRGRDTHHTTEAAFKAFAKALRRALEPRGSEISTKGAARTTAAAPAAAPPPPQAVASPAEEGEALQPAPRARRASMEEASREVKRDVEERQTKEFQAAKARAAKAAKAARGAARRAKG